MNFKESIKANSHEFMTLCKSHDVKSLYAFGSAISDRFNEDQSDIDLLVDLLTSTSIRNPILKKSIDSSKILVYDGKELKISF